MLEPLAIGSVTLAHRILFGPMAGISDLPYRLLCHEQGAALTCTELISAKAITYHNKNTHAMLAVHEEEHPVAVQIFGHEEEVMADAVRMLPLSFDILDINMGCPVPKVVSNGEGSALMKDPALIERIVRACVQASPVPVTVKMRAGFDPRHVNAKECALAAQAGGAAAVTVHARTRDQMYAGRADWSVIRGVKESVHIPVIGNGDVRDARDARRMREETGCDAVMIARAAQGNPWVFREILHELETGERLPRPDGEEILAMVLRHAGLLAEHKGETIAVREMRKHIAWYTTGLTGAAAMRERVNTLSDMEQLKAACEAFFGSRQNGSPRL
ncbi:MAG: tRNA dihydrouridine synthase DusB [Lachnospiraceae bacterium]|nr:tRNA dihydrouridine synthase DusB [Lachnospiraceae bacterium]